MTLRQFHSKDKYNPRDAPDRHNRRAMEAENKKLRGKARKDFNDSVHNLVYHRLRCEMELFYCEPCATEIYLHN